MIKQVSNSGIKGYNIQQVNAISRQLIAFPTVIAKKFCHHFSLRNTPIPAPLYTPIRGRGRAMKIIKKSIVLKVERFLFLDSLLILLLKKVSILLARYFLFFFFLSFFIIGERVNTIKIPASELAINAIALAPKIDIAPLPQTAVAHPNGIATLASIIGRKAHIKTTAQVLQSPKVVIICSSNILLFVCVYLLKNEIFLHTLSKNTA